jgi:hypothetical protein
MKLNNDLHVQDVVWYNMYCVPNPDYTQLFDDLRALNLEESDVWQIVQDVRAGDY